MAVGANGSENEEDVDMQPALEVGIVQPFPITKLDQFHDWVHGELTLVGDLEKQDFIDHFTMILQQPNMSWGIMVGGKLSGVLIFEPCSWPGDATPTYICVTVGLDPKVRGSGVIQKFAPIAVSQAFTAIPSVNRFNAMIPAENWPERKLAEYIGFKQEGLMREGITIHNQLQDLVVYGLTRKDFYNGLL